MEKPVVAPIQTKNRNAGKKYRIMRKLHARKTDVGNNHEQTKGRRLFDRLPFVFQTQYSTFSCRNQSSCSFSKSLIRPLYASISYWYSKPSFLKETSYTTAPSSLSSSHSSFRTALCERPACLSAISRALFSPIICLDGALETL